MSTLLIRLAGDKPGVKPEQREPTVGKWYAGVELDEANDSERFGELMRYDGEGTWLNENEDLDGREPDPFYYDYLQEQL